MKRLQENPIIEDLQEKYVFLGGPRQSGKTTLSRQLFNQNTQYLNYDRSEDRQIILNGEWNRDAQLIIMDEFHKYPSWKTFIKGYFDTEGPKPPILVTGSAKLNIFKKGNDSMVGRYYYHRLLPLSVKELETSHKHHEACESLLEFGNFPEPFISQSKRKSKRWRENYLERIIREDVTDSSHIRNIAKIQLLVDILRQRVGSSISYSSIAQGLEVAPKTIKEWIDLLEMLYIVFRITPYHQNIARSILKEPKIYFFDCQMAFSNDAHLENLVAVSLLKHLWFLEDNEGIKGDLCYLRTKDGKEIDFVTVIDRKIEEIIEVKNRDDQPGKAFAHFDKFIAPKKKFLLVRNLRQKKSVGGIQVQSVSEYLSNLLA